MATTLKIRADGVILHRHPTSANPDKGWHPTKEMHRNDDCHATHVAATPVNAALLSHAWAGTNPQTSAELKAAYRLNLDGKEPAFATADWKVKVAAASIAKAQRDAVAIAEATFTATPEQAADAANAGYAVVV